MRTALPLLVLISLTACAAPDPRPTFWSSRHGPLDSRVLGEIIRYTHTIDQAAASARAQLQACGYTLIAEHDNHLTFLRPLGPTLLSLDIALEPSPEGYLRSCTSLIQVRSGPNLTETQALELNRETSQILSPLTPDTYLYIQD